jgi:hypothetical protein
MNRFFGVTRLKSEWFIPALIAVVGAASLFPCYGAGVRIGHGLAAFAISSLFFLQGARLSRVAITAGIMNWRLHLGIASATFVLFPVLGLGLLALLPSLPQSIQIGALFVCVLPSTVQSSVALTSIARGSVAGAICAATASNIVGMVLSPMMLAFLLQLHGGSIALDGLWKILLQLLVPFAAGHALRPWIGEWGRLQSCNSGAYRSGLDPYRHLHRVQRGRDERHLAPVAAAGAGRSVLGQCASARRGTAGNEVRRPPARFAPRRWDRDDFLRLAKIFGDRGADGATVVFRPGCRGHRGPNNDIPSAPVAGRRLAGSSVYRYRTPSGDCKTVGAAPTGSARSLGLAPPAATCELVQAMARMGHEERFPPPKLSVGCAFRKETIAGISGLYICAGRAPK